MLSIKFILFGLIVFFPILIFRSPFLKISIIIYAYPVWLLYGYSIGIQTTRVVYNIGLQYYSEYFYIGFLYSLLSYLFFILVLLPIRKKEFYFFKLPFGSGFHVLIVFFTLIFLPIAYPSAYFLGDSRFGSLGGVLIVLLSLSICSVKGKNNLLIYFVLFVCIFSIIRGERVDFILCLLAIYFLHSNKHVNIFKIGFSCVLLLILGLFSIAKRSGWDITISSFLDLIIINITQFGTAVDVIHVYMSSIWYYNEIGFTILPLFNYVFSFIPIKTGFGGASSDINFVAITRQYIPNLGGGMFYIPFIIAIGSFGAVLSGLFYGFLTRFLFTRKGIWSFIFIPFFIMQFRIQWYGFNYFGTVCILSIFIVIYINRLKLLGYMRKGKEKNHKNV
ncbi:hypothetical protein NM432_12195 [Vibrio metschnikovii]